MRVAADFFPLWKVFLDTDFIILLRSYCIQVRLCYNIVLLFDSHYIYDLGPPVGDIVRPNKISGEKINCWCHVEISRIHVPEKPLTHVGIHASCMWRITYMHFQQNIKLTLYIHHMYICMLTYACILDLIARYYA